MPLRHSAVRLGIVVALGASTAVAAIRINGNQLVTSAGTYDAVTVARAPAATGVVNRLIFNLGQGVSGRSDAQGEPPSGVYTFGFGLVYDINNVALEHYCPVAITGDVNLSGTITSADIINLVNFVFKGGLSPQPCIAAGDVNCSGTITSADIISTVNFVFKGGSEPCNACYLIPGTWRCP